MCDFPNIENNELELEMLSEFCDEWNRRIEFLPKLLRQGHADESLILCRVYIEAIGRWLYTSELSDRETFAKALIRHGGNDAFGRVNPVCLISELKANASASEDPDALKRVATKLSPAIAALQDRFYPEEEVLSICRPALEEEEFALLVKSLWMGTLAGLAHEVTECGRIHDGAARLGTAEEVVFDHGLFYPALKRVFESARRLIMAGKLKIW